jgi:hypothetical protein
VNTLDCPLGAVHLVLNKDVVLKMPSQRERYARWPIGPADIEVGLRALDQGVPAFVEQGRGKYEGETQIIVCTSAYHLLAVPSKYNNAYFVPWMEPLSLHQHERLARGALMLKATQWCVHTDYNTLPPGSDNAIASVLRAWQALQARVVAISPSTFTITAAQQNYLKTISKLIEVTRQLVRDKAALLPAAGYSKVESAGEVRLVRDVYTFHLVPRAPRLNEGDSLRLRDVPDLRGRVMRMEGNRLTVKFEGMVDRVRIPEQGVLERTVPDKPFQIQQQAVRILEEGESKNPHLLPILVEHTYQSYRPSSIRPSIPLNKAQTEAFCLSDTVPDLLMVLGPPGTGKTKTIAEIVRQHSAQHRRVLVTAKTHKAVDNVLERLPNELTVVRIGHEDRASDNTKHLLIDAQARTLQATFLHRTEACAQALSDVVVHADEIEHRVKQLAESAMILRQTQDSLNMARQELNAADEHLQVLYGRTMDRLRASLKSRVDELQRLDARIADLSRQQTDARSKRRKFVVGLLWGWWSDRLARHQTKVQVERQRSQAAHDADARAYVQAQTAWRRALRAPEYHQLELRVEATNKDYQNAARSALEIARSLDRVVAGLIDSRPPLEPVSPMGVQRYLTWFHSIIPLLQSRHAILSDWRERLSLRAEDLYPLIVRFADVVGATCIGIATDSYFEPVDFDLVIADEAGQISLPDLLVPLVRAGRAMLVGDHHQLPPFVEDEVRVWLERTMPEALPDISWVDEETTEAEEVMGLLAQSTFELLFPTADPTHIVRFNEQYRMPQAVADFASQCFYDNRLKTAEKSKLYDAPHSDPLFNKPLAFVDTSALPQKQRRDSSPGQDPSDPESWGKPGYINPLEASLIADIAALYEHKGIEWVVIVPYRAQAQRIQQELSRRLPAATDSALDERVATVDSFQGGECDCVIYGFTRSNSEGKIGFLRELRRLNVAITRAKQQLVLVGDVWTLTRANDTPFRNLALSLLAHVRQNGELVSYQECQSRLTSKR